MRTRSVVLALILALAVVIAGFALATRGGMNDQDCARLYERSEDYRAQGDIVRSKEDLHEWQDKCSPTGR